MRKLVVVGIVAVLSLTGAACGGDDDDDAGGGGGGGGGGDFCDQARALDEQDTEDISPEESLESLRDISDDAPDELQDEIDLLIELGELVVEAGDDPEAQAEAFADVDQEELTTASATLTAYLEEECGITEDDGDDVTEETTTE